MKAKDYYSADQTNPPKDPEGCDAGKFSFWKKLFLI